MLNSLMYLFPASGSNHTIGSLNRQLREQYYRMNPLGEDYPYRRQLTLTQIPLRNGLRNEVAKDANSSNT